MKIQVSTKLKTEEKKKRNYIPQLLHYEFPELNQTKHKKKFKMIVWKRPGSGKGKKTGTD